MNNFYRNKKILITGGTGSLGKALISRLLSYGSEILVYSRDEGKQAPLRPKWPGLEWAIGDVRDFNKFNTCVQLSKPDYVIHAGALKRINDLEYHPDECIKTNIRGSDNVARSCALNNVARCMLISTDKACHPINVYGASKFIAERTFTNYDFNSEETIFASVRYGNVIASRGSFIPLWLQLLEEKKPIPITSLDCTRFLFPLSAAVDTVLSALMLAEGGEVMVPLINSFSMHSVIRALEGLSGHTAGPLDIIGLRPGEKLHEDMLSVSELDFARSITPSLITVLPQYTKRSHSFSKKYTGDALNSSLHLNSDIDFLISLIQKGVEDGSD